MELLTLELFDVTVSAALREINTAVEEHPGLPLRILLGGDEMLHHNILRFLERHGRAPRLRSEGGHWRIDAAGLAAPPPAPPTPLPATFIPMNRPAPSPAPILATPARLPILLTRSALGLDGAPAGRRGLLGILRELDPGVPWVCLALEALALLEDPLALRTLEALQSRGTPVRISRDSQLFPSADTPFELMEDSQWQRLAGRGELIIL